MSVERRHVRLAVKAVPVGNYLRTRLTTCGQAACRCCRGDACLRPCRMQGWPPTGTTLACRGDAVRKRSGRPWRGLPLLHIVEVAPH
ncbi:hypothetical protein BHM03_00005379 [Ensete ventricosum]|uniref:Uncharacterized protein n=1 Tax=Ensete ventricosum TaxID=4639 RepID=A0A445MBB9_ENSVE|nr:hypothetical protein BHM03_00005379 [Ensete ventricosum]